MKPDFVHALRVALPAAVVGLLVFSAACGGEGQAPGAGDTQAQAPTAAPARSYTLGDLAAIGWKQKDPFTMQFPGATEAFWGFMDAREVAVVVYPSPSEASTRATAAGGGQTQVLEDGSYAPGVERYKCQVIRSGSMAVMQSLPDLTGECAPIPGKMSLGSACLPVFTLSGEGRQTQIETPPEVSYQTCLKRLPTYAEYVIEGNLLLLCESKAQDADAECEAVASKLRETTP